MLRRLRGAACGGIALQRCGASSLWRSSKPLDLSAVIDNRFRWWAMRRRAKHVAWDSLRWIARGGIDCIAVMDNRFRLWAMRLRAKRVASDS